MSLKALVLNCTLKPSPQESNTEALARVVMETFGKHGVESKMICVLDCNVKPGVSSDEGDGDEWSIIRSKILASNILIMASPTWLGQMSSAAKRVLERMDAMLSEKDDQGQWVAYNRVAGFVVTGNEDGAHHVINEMSGTLLDIGFTIPGTSVDVLE